jgi:hypothetical protein
VHNEATVHQQNRHPATRKLPNGPELRTGGQFAQRHPISLGAAFERPENQENRFSPAF